MGPEMIIQTETEVKTRGTNDASIIFDDTVVKLKVAGVLQENR
jgi:hypothetical protein